MRILVTGTTGYIGGRLVPHLLEGGHEVRCLARHPSELADLPWRDRVEVVAGDVLDPDTLTPGLAGCAAAFYLVNPKDSNDDSTASRGAANFRDAADRAGLRRIVHLDALGPDDAGLPPHPDGRHDVGHTLASGDTPVTELRAAVIIGSGSMSFEMLRYLTEALPVMTTPRWTRTRCQPIAIRDVLELLQRAVEDGGTGDHVLEIGGPDVLTYQEMMRVYARETGLRRVILPVPLRAPGLSSRWVGLVTPLPSRVARPLVKSLRGEAVVTDDTARRLFPHDPTPYVEAVRRALDHTPDHVSTRWSDAASAPAGPTAGDPDWSGGTVYLDRRVVPTDAEPHHVFWAFSRIGGDVGYYGLNWAWRLRGFMDRLVGGVGLRRGRRDPEHVREGETVDFWRVDKVDDDRILRLRAEMRLPGDAWLQWEIHPMEQGSDLVQSAIFRPRGLLGRLYWFVMAPFHSIIFPRMANRMAAAAEERGYACLS